MGQIVDVDKGFYQEARAKGVSPLTYLTRWRMAIAARMLRDGSETIGQIAGRVGYEAEAAFNKAFKRWNGQPPGAFRRASARAVAPAS